MNPNSLRQRLVAAFLNAFDSAPTVLVQAPGRVNLIGEHTDYNDGFVLPCAIAWHTAVALRPRADLRVQVVAADFGHARDEFSLAGPIPHVAKPAWANYVRGIFELLRRSGAPLRGVQLVVAGDLPRGAGLSSSASLQVAVALALRDALALPGLDDVAALARLAQQAENQFVGCPCGIMDPLASAAGQAGHALLMDCRSLQWHSVPVPADMAVMVVNSQVRRGLVDSEYGLRRQQCQQAAQALGVPALRDATPQLLDAAQPRMDPLAWRRARHVVGENLRTQAAAQALAAGDLATLGTLMAQSHEAMRHDFEITVPAVDQLVAVLQQAIGGQGGARMTGGGFGGCVVALLPQALVDAARHAVQRHYRAPGGESATVWVTQPADGAGALPA